MGERSLKILRIGVEDCAGCCANKSEMTAAMTTNDHPRTLVAKAQNGDRSAFDALVGLYRDRLILLIHSRLGKQLGRYEDAEDILQEAVIEAFQSLERFQWRGDDSFLRWLGAIFGALGAARRDAPRPGRARSRVRPAYRFPLPPGEYRRKSDMLVEGNRQLEGCEFKIREAERHVVKTWVDDGLLDIEFVHESADNPEISAIEIERLE